MLLKKSIALIGLTGAAALSLTACSAGQITQTSDQVAAVDGAAGDSATANVGVRDVAIVVDGTDTAAVRFTAFNSEISNTSHNLESVTVDGAPVTLRGDTELKRNCSIVADSQSAIDAITKSDDLCINYITTSLRNTGFAAGGTKQVLFRFDNNATVTVDAAIVAPTPVAGQEDRVIGDAHSDEQAAH